jgi:hypothetical protein
MLIAKFGDRRCVRRTPKTLYREAGEAGAQPEGTGRVRAVGLARLIVTAAKYYWAKPDKFKRFFDMRVHPLQKFPLFAQKNGSS